MQSRGLDLRLSKRLRLTEDREFQGGGGFMVGEHTNRTAPPFGATGGEFH